MKVLPIIFVVLIAGCAKPQEEITVVTPSAETQISERKLEVEQNGTQVILTGTQYEPVQEEGVRQFLKEHPHTFRAVYDKETKHIEAEFAFADTGAAWTVAMTNEVLDDNTLSEGQAISDEIALCVLKDMVHFINVTIE